MIISCDSEVTGLDIYHGARPYIITLCELDKDPLIWEWDVNPITRKPEVPKSDLKDILDILNSADEIVAHNLKYDVCAITHLYMDHGINLNWPWEKSQDTVLCGHLLASNHPHNLTDMVLEYLSTPTNPVNIEPYELAVKEACNEARRIARSHFPLWRIAKKGEEDMPSAKGEPWKNDMWLPRALAPQLGYEEDHPWYTVTRDYAIHDSFFTVQLWRVVKQKLQQRGDWELYEKVRRKLPRIQNIMESRGVTVSETRLKEQIEKFRKGSEQAKETCTSIAAGYNYPLTLPKSGNNDSLHTFVFDTLNLRQSKWSERTGKPSMDKGVLEQWELELPPENPAHDFIQALMRKRRQDTAISYLEGYTRFWLPTGIDGYKKLHPNTNPTGTDTLRWSFTNPNSANLSKQEGFNLRYAFGPAEGREWYSADAKNIELRIPAYEAQEPDMMYIFDHPEEPPYFGSYHLLVFDLLHPQLFKEHGKKCKDLFESTWYQWVKNGNFCVPMDTLALTRTGWKCYNDIVEGDEVLGYDNGILRWTPVLEKYYCDNAPLMQIENCHFKATTTPNHRWLSKRRTGRSSTRKYVEEFVESERITTEHVVTLSAPVIDNCQLDITPTEAAIIGFVYGDGHIEKRSEYVGAPSQAKGRKLKCGVKIHQKKPEGIKYVENLLETWGRGFRKYARPTGIVTWVLPPDFVRDLWCRAKLPLDGKTGDMEEFVLRLGAEHRKAYLEAVHIAEGHIDAKGAKLYGQNTGSFADSIRLAIFMSGKFPTTVHQKTYYPTDKQMTSIRESKPYVTGQRMWKHSMASGPVWCIKTELSTWVMKQGNQIMLTGNSIQYGAQEKKADATYHVLGAFQKIRSRFTRIAKLNDTYKAAADKYGSVCTIPRKSVGPNGYPLLCTRTEYGKVLPTVPFCYHVSGTAMDWMQHAMIKCQDKLDEWNAKLPQPEYFMIMQVHDELVFDFPKRADPTKDPKCSNLWRIKELQKIMESCGDDINIPTPVGVEYHPHNYAEGIGL